MAYKAYVWGWVSPYISRIHTAYMGEYLHFRYLYFLDFVGLIGTMDVGFLYHGYWHDAMTR